MLAGTAGAAGADAAYFQHLFTGFCYSATACILFPIYGMVQERIMTQPYGDEFYTFTIQLSLFDRMFGSAFALALGLINKDKIGLVAPAWKYGVVSLTRGGFAWLQYEALKYTTYPMLMLGKSFKMMPVMLWGYVISRKRYSMMEWIFTCGVTTGVALFVTLGKISDARHGSGWGLLFILGILLSESFALTWQDKLFQEYGMSSFNQLMWVNFFSGVIFFIVLCIMGLPESFAFWGRHPTVIADLAYVSMGVAVSQFCGYQIIKYFGALASSTVLNIRQLVAIIASYVVYRHPITSGQIVGLIVTFGFVFWKLFYDYQSKKAADKAKLKENQEIAIVDKKV